MSALTVVMYHRVFGKNRARHPELRGIDVAEFEEQLGYLKRHHKLVALDDCLAAVAGECTLPPKAALLTFDDGYLDHFTNVFPILRKAGAPAVFFPCAKPIREGKLLQPNKLHFILAAATPKVLLEKVFAWLDTQRETGAKFPPNELLWKKLGLASRFDSAEVIFIKRLLQRELPKAQREALADRLFQEFVKEDEACLAAETYCTLEQLRIMVDDGFSVGAHGWDHEWWDNLGAIELEHEIQRSLELLTDLGADTDHWSAAYPYGANSPAVREKLAQRGCKIAFTTRLGIAPLSSTNALMVERLDTQDLPKKSSAGPAPWTKEAFKTAEAAP